jgi:gas vesicle protein
MEFIYNNYECYTNNNFSTKKTTTETIKRILFQLPFSATYAEIIIEFAYPQIASLFCEKFIKVNPGYRQDLSTHNNTIYYYLSDNEKPFSNITVTLSQQTTSDLEKICEFLGQHSVSEDILTKIKANSRQLSDSEQEFYDALPSLTKGTFPKLLELVEQITNGIYKVQALWELAAVSEQARLEDEWKKTLERISNKEEALYKCKAVSQLTNFNLTKKRLKRTIDKLETCTLQGANDSLSSKNLDEQKKDLAIDIGLALEAGSVIELRNTILSYLGIGRHRAKEFFREFSSNNKSDSKKGFINLMVDTLVYTKAMAERELNIQPTQALPGVHQDSSDGSRVRKKVHFSS